MADILFVTWDGGGNVPPALGIADELRRRGHHTRFLGHAGQAATVTSAGHAFHPYTEAEPFVGAEPASVPRLVRLFSDRGMGRDLVAETTRQPADLIVVDALLLGALDGAARHGLRHVTLQHLFDGYQRGAWLHGPVGLWARVRGLRPVRRWDAAAVVLSATLPRLDPGFAGAAANLRFTGPVVDPPSRTATFKDPLVLVSLSTFHYRGMQEVLQRVVDATDGLDARVVVTTGAPIDPREVRAHARAEVHRLVPHDEVMPEASLVVTHGGHGTAMRALAHDLPVLVLPVDTHLDHPMVGAAIETAGAGRCLKKSTPPDRLREVMAGLLAEGPHRRAAARLGDEIRRMDGAASAAATLEDLLRREPSPSTTTA